jgi:hypothetical protein
MNISGERLKKNTWNGVQDKERMMFLKVTGMYINLKARLSFQG